MNPWWWLEASPDILVGADCIQYRDPQDFVKENNLVVSSMGPHVQAVLNFSHNEEEDGGTIVVPEFHSHLAQWCEEHSSVRKPVPFVTFYEKNEEEHRCEQSLLRQSRRVPMKAGSVLIWNQTLAHGTQPNASRRNRAAQFLKAFSRSHVFLNESLVEASRSYSKQREKEKEKEKEMMMVFAGKDTGGKDKKKGKQGQRQGQRQGQSQSQCMKQHRCPPEEWIWNGRARLARRSRALRDLLREANALKIVTPLGESLFGLDVLSQQLEEEEEDEEEDEKKAVTG